MALSPSLISIPLTPSLSPCLFPSLTSQPKTASLRRRFSPKPSVWVAVSINSAAVMSPEEESAAAAEGKIGARVRVTADLKIYHVAKAPEIELTGREGKLKQYVAAWKGKKISANLPFKVEFVADVEGKGKVKFFAHLKEDEFEYID